MASISLQTDAKMPSRGRLSLLIVDDSLLQRRILISALKDEAFDIRDAADGEAALALCRERMPDIVISDWMMPGMSGLDLCRELRELTGEDYVYFVILTSKSEKAELAEALTRGADDFLSKPLSSLELTGRIAAGERLLKMSRELGQKNRIVTRTLEALREAHEVLDGDLLEARRLQMSLAPSAPIERDGWRISFLLKPSGALGGDLVGCFDTGPSRIGLYGLDVSGHGVAAALLTMRLSSWLSGRTPDLNLALGRAESGRGMRPTGEVCEDLNARFLGSVETDHYFTILLGELDFDTGAFTFSQAGHPPPLLQRADGTTRLVGDGGPPIGLLPDVEVESHLLKIGPGERLLIYSDGVTECPTPDGSLFDEQGLAAFMRRHRELRGDALFRALEAELDDLVGPGGPPDDLSAVLIERVAGI